MKSAYASIRLKPEVKKKLEQIAAREARSLSQVIARLIDKAMSSKREVSHG